MPPAGHTAGGASSGGGGGKHGQGQNGGGGDGADFMDFKRSHEYNWSRLVWAHGWTKIHSGGPKALESSWKYLPPNGRFGPGAVEGRDYFATLDDVIAFCKKTGPAALPSSRQHQEKQQQGQAAAAIPIAPPSPTSLAATAALAEQGRARAEGLSRRQRLEAVFCAAFDGDAPLLAALLKVDKSLVKAEAEGGEDGEDDGATPLLIASRRGHVECVRVLLDDSPLIIKQVDSKGRSALHYAAQGDKVDVARLLVSRGLKPTFRRPDEGHTPLMVACRWGSSRVGRFLLAECPAARAPEQMKIRNLNGETAYMLAAKHGHQEMAQLLVQAGAEPSFDTRPTRKQQHQQPPQPLSQLLGGLQTRPQGQQGQQAHQRGGAGNPVSPFEGYRSEFAYTEHHATAAAAAASAVAQEEDEFESEAEDEDDDDGPLLVIPTEAEAGPRLEALNARLLRAAIAMSLGQDPRPHLGLPALPKKKAARRGRKKKPAQQAAHQAPQGLAAARAPQQQQSQQRPAPVPVAAQAAAGGGAGAAARRPQPPQPQPQQPAQQTQARPRANSNPNSGGPAARAPAPAPARASSSTSGSTGRASASLSAPTALAAGRGWQEDKATAKKGKKEAKRRQELLGRLTEEEMMDVPEDLLCPISLELLSEGVVCEDGYTYQRVHFEAWITQCESEGKPLTSPMTRQPVSPIWFPNRSIHQRVEEYLLKIKEEKEG